MLTNEKRREILETARAVGYKGSVLDLYNAARAGQDISQLLQPQNMEVAQTPEQQSQGLRPQHAAGNTNASMAFPDVPPNTPFSTEGMKAPINISKFDDQGHLVQSFKNVPPGIQSLPTGPGKGTVIETPAYKKGGYKAKYQLGGVKKHQGGDFRNLDPRLANNYTPTDATSVGVDIADPYIANRSQTQRVIDEAVPQTVSTYVEPSTADKILNRAANPFTTAGYVVRGQQIPDRVGDKANSFDMAADVVNPAAWADYGLKANRDLHEGNFIGAGLNALGAVPAIPSLVKAPAALSKFPALPGAKKLVTGIKNAPAKINPRYFKPSEDLWYRQVGKSAIDDIAESKVIRERGEDILNSQKVYEDRVLRMKGIDPDTGKPFANYETQHAQQLLGARRPKSPYFQKGELYWGMNRKPGKGRPGRGGDADSAYLIESLLGDNAFHPAHVKGMFPDTPNKWVGDIGILKPKPEFRNPSSFNVYKRNWWSGYKPVKYKSGGYRNKYQTAGQRVKTYTDYDKFTEHNNAYQDSTALNKYYEAQLQAEEEQSDRSKANYDAQVERLKAGEIDTSRIGDLRKLGDQIIQNSDGRLQWSGSSSGSTSPDLQYYNAQDDPKASLLEKMYSTATEGKSLIKGANKYWLGNAYNATWDKPKVKPVFMDESDPYGASKQESIPMSNQPVLYEEEWEPKDKGGDVHESTAKKHNDLRKRYPKLDSLYTTPSALLRYNDRLMSKLDKIDPETSFFMPSDTTFYDSNLGLVVNAGRYDPKESAKLDPNDGNPFGVETYMEFSEPSVKKESAVKLTPKSAKLGNYTPLELIPPIPPQIYSRKLNQQSGQYMYDTNFGKFNLDIGDQDANFVRTYRTQIDDLRRNRSKYQFGGRQGDTFQEVDTYIKPGQNTRPNWAQTPDAVTNYTFGKNLVDDESRFSLGLQGTDILDEIKYRGDLIANAGIGIGNRKGKSFRPAGENLRAGVRGQASWQGVPGNVIENMFPRSGVDVRGSFEGEAGLAYANGAVSPYMSVTPQTNFSLNDNLTFNVGYEMRGRYDKNRNNPIYGSTGTGTVAPLSQRDAYSGMGRGAGRLSLKYDMGDGDFVEGYYSKPNSLYQGSMYPVPGVIALENEGPRFGVRLKKSF